MKSIFGTINWSDVLKGFLLAILTVVITGIYTTLQLGQLPTLSQLGSLAIAGLSAGIAYLLKQVFTNSAGQLGTTESNVTTVVTPTTITKTIEK